MNKKSILGFLAVILVSGIASARVCVFEHANFSGNRLCWESWERGTSNLDRTGMNDEISSIEISQGEVVQVCEHANFGGSCRTYYNDVYNLDGDFNDRISSISIRGGGHYPPPPPPPPPPRGEICFYQHANFQGASFCLSPWDRSVSNLSRTGFNDEISSIRIPHGVTIAVFEHADFQGQRRDFSYDVYNLEGNFNDMISSIMIYGR